MKLKVILICLFSLLLASSKAQLIQGTIKSGVADSIEIWIKPDFSNNTQYLFQLGFPIAFPATANPVDLHIQLAPEFIAAFGNNYSVTLNPLAANTGNTEKYFNVVLVRSGVGASNPQNWTSGTEFKVFSALFTPVSSPASQVKLADYQDGGSDGQGNFYIMDGNANYYVTANSVGNFYASPGHSTAGGTVSVGFSQTIANVPCTFPVVQPISGTTTFEVGQTTQLNNATLGGTWSSDDLSIAIVDANGLVTGLTAGITTIHYSVTNGCGTRDVTVEVHVEQRLIVGTIKKGASANEIEIWIKPYFSNSTEYLFQLGFPIAFPSSVDPQLIAQDITLDPAFKADFGDNYSVTVNPVAQNTVGTEKYFNVILIRNGLGASTAQTWTGSKEYRVFTASFRNLTTSVLMKLADYQDGGSDGQANFYSMDGHANYYVVGNSVNNFYAVSGQSAIGGNASAGYVQLIPLVAPSCGDPTGLTVGTVNATSVENITWNASAGALGYEIAVTQNGNPPGSGTSVTSTNHTETGLLPGTSYFVHVRANCAPGIFSGWITINFNTLCPTITPEPTIGQITMTNAAVNWTSVSGVTGYQYAVTTNQGSPTSWNFTTGTSFPVTNLSAGTLYYVHIRSVCSPGIFSAWTSKSFTTAYPPCNPTFIPVITNVTNSAAITWTSLSGVTGYEYNISTSSIPPAAGTPTTVNNYLATGLNSATQYYAHVRVNCGPGGYSIWYTRAFTTPCFKPAPFIIENTPTAGTIDLGWIKISGALKYEYAILGNIISPVGSLSFTSDTVLHATDLRPGSKYYLHVRTQCSPGNNSEWSILEFHTSGVNVYPNPTTGMITVTAYGPNVNNGEIVLLDAIGKQLKRVRLTGNVTSIDMSSYASGIYFIRNETVKKYVVRIIKR
jgi:hypothetical protein